MVSRCAELTEEIRNVEGELDALVTLMTPALLAVHGVGLLTAAKLIGETADVHRFKSKDAYARPGGTAPLPVWSRNRNRHRLSRTGNRQINACLHRIAITQARSHEGARALLQRRRENGDSKSESIRILKRRLSDVVFRALLLDAVAESAATELSAA
jgi:transposase